MGLTGLNSPSAMGEPFGICAGGAPMYRCMNVCRCMQASLVFVQLMDHVPLHMFRRCLARYPSRYSALSFPHLDQFLVLAFA